MTVTVRAAAELELDDAFVHYSSIRGDLGEGFIDEFRRAVDQILLHPRGWQSLDSEYRRCRLHRFPYGVIYRIDAATDEIVIVSISHLHRRPQHWRGRR